MSTCVTDFDLVRIQRGAIAFKMSVTTNSLKYCLRYAKVEMANERGVKSRSKKILDSSLIFSGMVTVRLTCTFEVEQKLISYNIMKNPPKI